MQEPDEVKKEGWRLLREELPDNHPALKQLDRSVYGVGGLTDVAEWFLWERLEQSKLRWELTVEKINYLGCEDRPVRNQNYTQRWYLVSVEGHLIVDGKPFPCVGASENRKLDAAYKGALTSLFKNGCKWAGLTMWLYKGGKIIDSLDTENEETPPLKSPTSQTTSLSAGHSAETVRHAVEVTDGKIITSEPAKPAQPVQLTAASFDQNELAQKRVRILEEFNQALPNPNAEPWVRSNIALFLVRQENNQLTPDMIDKKTPINYVFHLLVAMHGSQCKPSCTHSTAFFEKLKSVK